MPARNLKQPGIKGKEILTSSRTIRAGGLFQPVSPSEDGGLFPHDAAHLIVHKQPFSPWLRGFAARKCKKNLYKLIYV